MIKRHSFLARALTLAAMATVGSASMAQTPLVYYNFNEPVGATTLLDSNLDGGTAFDASYQGSGTPTYGEGILGGAWSGSGQSDDFFETAAITDLSGVVDLSISLWINPTSTPGFDGVFTTRSAETNLGNVANPTSGNFGINQQGNQIDARTQTGPTTSIGIDTPIGSIAEDVWTHVVYTYDGIAGIVNVYLDGALSVSSNNPSIPIDLDFLSGGAWSIGNDGQGNREFAGRIDDLAMYDTLLFSGDVSTIYNNGLNGIALDGTPNPLAGDVDGNGFVQAFISGDNNDDYDPILDNLLDTVATGSVDTRPLGDLTNDGVVNLADFRSFKNAFSGSPSATVPEPTTTALIGVVLLGAAAGMRRRSSSALLPVAVIAAVSLGGEANAQVVATVNQETGNITVANNGMDDVVFDGYSFQSANGLLDPAGWSNFEVDQSAEFPGWDRIGPENANQLGEQLLTAGASISFPASDDPLDFGGAFSPANLYVAQSNQGLGVDVRDLVFQYREPGVFDGTTGTVEYVGAEVTNNLVVKIGSDGTASLENESPNAVLIDGFALTSASGALNDSWAGSPDLPLGDSGWQLGSPSVNGLSQVSLASDTTLDGAVSGVVQAGGTIDLGDIFSVGGETDVEFRFLRVGEDDGAGFLGVVEYDPALEPIAGDYNDDGFVDAVDYVVWRDADGTATVLPNDLTPGTVDSTDYDVWAANYGAGTPLSAVAVPEPSTVALLALVGAAVAQRKTRVSA